MIYICFLSSFGNSRSWRWSSLRGSTATIGRCCTSRSCCLWGLVAAWCWWIRRYIVCNFNRPITNTFSRILSPQQLIFNILYHWWWFIWIISIIKMMMIDGRVFMMMVVAIICVFNHCCLLMHLSFLSSFIDLCDGLLSSCCSTRSLLSQLPFLQHTHTHGAYTGSWDKEECICCCVYDERLLLITSSCRWERQIAEVDWRSNLPLLLYPATGYVARPIERSIY